jgi:hypothetical protein
VNEAPGLNRGGFHKTIFALHLKFVLHAHPFLFNLASSICALYATCCIFSLSLYAVRPTFMKSTPGLVVIRKHVKSKKIFATFLKIFILIDKKVFYLV